MADNINITEGTGAIIGTDDVGSVHFQRVKLVGGELGSTARRRLRRRMAVSLSTMKQRGT